jgi:hypothetical protein
MVYLTIHVVQPPTEFFVAHRWGCVQDEGSRDGMGKHENGATAMGEIDRWG